MHSVSLESLSQQQQQDSWKKELTDSIFSVSELLDRLDLGHLSGKILHDPEFRLRVPRAYVEKMALGDAADPLLLQVLPALNELDCDGVPDPVGDLNAMVTPGLLHKYHGRVLLITTGACAIHCRYCFRRHYPYAEASTQASNWQAVLDYLQQHPEVHEVILSGGDPLILDDAKLRQLCADLETIPHIKWLRLHTRLPVVLPSRINGSLLDWITASRFRVTVVIHCNHPNELGDAEMIALNSLRLAGVTLLNQSVLLRGINDNASTLIQLSQRLHDCGVIPYYLHLLDKVQGGLHFDVNQAKASEIMDNMRRNLPGFLLPRLVREDSGKDSKTAIFSI